LDENTKTLLQRYRELLPAVPPPIDVMILRFYEYFDTWLMRLENEVEQLLEYRRQIQQNPRAIIIFKGEHSGE
jgi:hypothetical protein